MMCSEALGRYTPMSQASTQYTMQAERQSSLHFGVSRLLGATGGGGLAMEEEGPPPPSASTLAGPFAAATEPCCLIRSSGRFGTHALPAACENAVVRRRPL